MTVRPWMPLYVADYLGDTAHLNAAEHGAYLLLIMHYWRVGGLPTEDRHLRRIACMTARQWRQSKATLQAFFSDGWKHGRIEFEMTQTARLSAAGRIGGRASATKKRDLLRSPNGALQGSPNEDLTETSPASNHSTISQRLGNDPATNLQALHSQSHKKEKERVSIETPKKDTAAAAAARAVGVVPTETAPEQAAAFAAAEGWPPGRIATEWAKFRDWHLAHGKARKNEVALLAAWRNWVRSPYQQQQTAKYQGAIPRPGSREDRAERAFHALQQAREYIENARAAENAGAAAEPGCDEPGDPPDVLLPGGGRKAP